MPKSDHEYFNCSEEHELNYVSNLYIDSDAVKDFLKENCQNGTIKNYTHERLYKLLEKNFFVKK